MPGQLEVQRTQPFAQNPPVYDVVFEFGNGSVRTIIMRDTVFDPVPVVSVSANNGYLWATRLKKETIASTRNFLIL